MGEAPQPRARVLVIDNEELIVDVIRMMLEDEYDVAVAYSGVEAQEILKRDPRFDVILCDLYMPEVSGIDLHRWLSAEMPATAHRMVFMTGGAYTTEAQAFEASVTNRFIQKPLAWPTVESTVREVAASA